MLSSFPSRPLLDSSQQQTYVNMKKLFFREYTSKAADEIGGRKKFFHNLTSKKGISLPEYLAVLFPACMLIQTFSVLGVMGVAAASYAALFMTSYRCGSRHIIGKAINTFEQDIVNGALVDRYAQTLENDPVATQKLAPYEVYSPQHEKSRAQNLKSVFVAAAERADKARASTIIMIRQHIEADKKSGKGPNAAP